MDAATLKDSLKAIADACRAAGFEPAMQACGEILDANRDMGLRTDTLIPIALRMSEGDWQYPGALPEPDLTAYDAFIAAGSDSPGKEESQ